MAAGRSRDPVLAKMVAAITDGLIFMAIAVVLVRTVGLGVCAFRLPG